MADLSELSEIQIHESVYLPADCPICGRHRLLWDGKILACEKCTTSSEFDGFREEAYKENSTKWAYWAEKCQQASGTIEELERRCLILEAWANELDEWAPAGEALPSGLLAGTRDAAARHRARTRDGQG